MVFFGTASVGEVEGGRGFFNARSSTSSIDDGMLAVYQCVGNLVSVYAKLQPMAGCAERGAAEIIK